MDNTNILKCRALLVQEIKDVVSWFKYVARSAVLVESSTVVEAILWYSNRSKNENMCMLPE